MRGWHYVSGSESSDVAVMESNDEKMLLIRDCEYDPATGKRLKVTTRVEMLKTAKAKE